MDSHSPLGSEYAYAGSAAAHTHAYLSAPVLQLLEELAPRAERRVLDLGCGNGSFARVMADSGWDVTGVDSSRSGIEQSKLNAPGGRFEVASAYDELAREYGTFPAITCLEVIEHLYDPHTALQNLCALLRPDGIAVLSTPYHGYWKNLALAATGKLDDHFTALWHHGHIKFFSKRTLSLLLRQVGMEPVQWKRVGRIPVFAKSMIVAARRARGP